MAGAANPCPSRAAPPIAARRRRSAPAMPFGGATGPAGFPLYQSAGLRRTAFAALFPAPFEGAILARPEMRPPHYPFRPCTGDPLRGADLEGAAGVIELC